MIPNIAHQEASFFSFEGTFGQIAFKWTPRAIVAGVAGYYSLGVAYHVGLMARIDYHAIQAFRHFFGYAGIGAFMPSFQQYSAWGVRVAFAIAAAIIYDITSQAVYFTAQKVNQFRKNIFQTQAKPIVIDRPAVVVEKVPAKT